MYDIVIIGGRVMDPETKLDALRNVGIKNGKIAIITEDKIEGKESVDAKGHVVAPGFIDMHHHNSGVPFGEKCAMRDGVTTPLELEVGVTKVKEVYNSLEGKCRLNYGFSSSTMSTREIILNPDYKSVYSGDFLYDVMGDPKDAKTSMKWSTEHMTAEQDKKFEELLENGIKEGALGIGHAVGYMTGGASQQDSITAQKVAGKYNMSTFVHGRFSGQIHEGIFALIFHHRHAVL